MSKRTLDFADGFQSSVEPSGAALNATDVTNTPSGNLAATDVQSALNEIQTEVDSKAAASDLTTHTGDTTNPHMLRVTEVQRDAIAAPSLGQVVFNTDTGTLNVYDGTVWGEISGAGGGVETYVEDFQLAASWTGYTTGGANAEPNGTWTADSSLTVSTYTDSSGKEYLQISKPASNCQGKGIYLDFLTPEIAKKVYVALATITDAGYVADDLKPFIWDTTAVAKVETTSGNRFTWQPNAASYNYRLALHVATASATAWSVKIALDHFSKEKLLNGVYRRSQVIDCTGSGAFTGGSIRVSRIGEQVTVDVLTAVTFASSATPASAVGLVPAWASPESGEANNVYLVQVSTGVMYFMKVLSDGQLQFVFYTSAGAGSAQTSSTDRASISYTVEDTSSDLMSTTDLMNVTAKVVAETAAGQSLAANTATKLLYGTEVLDSTNSYSSGTFTAPVTGLYEVDGTYLTASQAWTAGSAFTPYLYKNGVRHAQLGRSIFDAAITERAGGSMSGSAYLEKGDTLEIYGVSSAATSLHTDAAFNRISIKHVPDFSHIGITGETDFKEAYGSSGPAVAGGNAYQDLASITLEPGEWDLEGQVSTVNSAAASIYDVNGAISTYSGNTTTDHVLGKTQITDFNDGNQYARATAIIPRHKVTVTATTTYYLKGAVSTTTLTGIGFSLYNINARKIK